MGGPGSHGRGDTQRCRVGCSEGILPAAAALGTVLGLFAKSVFAECPFRHPGAKHKSMLEGHGTQMRRGRGKLLSRAGHKSKRIGNKGSINIQNKAFHCQVCEIYVNSETQLKQVTMPGLARAFLLGTEGHWVRGCRPLCTGPGGSGGGYLTVPCKKVMGVPRGPEPRSCCGSALAVLALGDPAVFLSQHMSSRRHKDRLAGKPPKPKYSPYNKLQKNAALAVSILKVSVSLQITHPVCSLKHRLPR